MLFNGHSLLLLTITSFTTKEIYSKTVVTHIRNVTKKHYKVYNTFNLHWYFSKLAFAVSSVILAQYINTILSSTIIGFHMNNIKILCYFWCVKMNRKC